MAARCFAGGKVCCWRQGALLAARCANGWMDFKTENKQNGVLPRCEDVTAAEQASREGFVAAAGQASREGFFWVLEISRHPLY